MDVKDKYKIFVDKYFAIAESSEQQQYLQSLLHL